MQTIVLSLLLAMLHLAVLPELPYLGSCPQHQWQWTPCYQDPKHHVLLHCYSYQYKYCAIQLLHQFTSRFSLDWPYCWTQTLRFSSTNRFFLSITSLCVWQSHVKMLGMCWRAGTVGLVQDPVLDSIWMWEEQHDSVCTYSLSEKYSLDHWYTIIDYHTLLSCVVPGNTQILLLSLWICSLSRSINKYIHSNLICHHRRTLYLTQAGCHL